MKVKAERNGPVKRKAVDVEEEGETPTKKLLRLQLQKADMLRTRAEEQTSKQKDLLEREKKARFAAEKRLREAEEQTRNLLKQPSVDVEAATPTPVTKTDKPIPPHDDAPEPTRARQLSLSPTTLQALLTLVEQQQHARAQVPLRQGPQVAHQDEQPHQQASQGQHQPAPLQQERQAYSISAAVVEGRQQPGEWSPQPPQLAPAQQEHHAQKMRMVQGQALPQPQQQPRHAAPPTTHQPVQVALPQQARHAAPPTPHHRPQVTRPHRAPVTQPLFPELTPRPHITGHHRHPGEQVHLHQRPLSHLQPQQGQYYPPSPHQHDHRQHHAQVLQVDTSQDVMMYTSPQDLQGSQQQNVGQGYRAGREYD